MLPSPSPSRLHLQLNFMDDFPDQLFSEEMAQALIQAHPDCVEWKEKAERFHQAMKELGMNLEKKVGEYAAALKAYQDKKAIPCERECEIGKHTPCKRSYFQY